jgi:hypothetical protein
MSPRGGAVPLSEHEQRLLEQMERALYAEDPKFATALRGSDLRRHFRRRILLGVVGLLAGIGLLLVGVVSKVVVVSVLGFLVMLGAALWAATSWRRMPAVGDLGVASAPGVDSGRRSGKAAKPKVMDRFEERWRRRREEDGR